MTNQEKDLSATLHQKLGVVECAPGCEIEKGVTVKLEGGALCIWIGSAHFWITADRLRGINEYAAKVGWQCD